MSKAAISALLMFVCVSFAANAGSDESQTNADVVEFRIAPGTGDGPWNTLAEPIRVRVGQILRFINDDSGPHYLHSDGTPCPHGSRAFGPGESYDCVISTPHAATDEDMYDHNHGPDAQVYVQAD